SAFRARCSNASARYSAHARLFARRSELMAERTTALKQRRRDWSARPRGTILDAERYTRFVTLMKRALPIAALVLLAAVAVYVFQPRQQDRMAMTFERVGEVANDLAMVKPRLSGSDAK